MWSYILIILFIFCYFRQHVERFGSLCNSDGKYICVETGEIRVSTKMPLITHYVNTCSVIVVLDKDNYLLGHIDDFKANMQNELVFALKNFNNLKKSKIIVYTGTKCNTNSCESLNIIKNALSSLDIHNYTLRKSNNGSVSTH